MGLNVYAATRILSSASSLFVNNLKQQSAMQKLSSGIRINSASDDAANLSISQKMTSATNANTIAQRNTQTGIAFLNTADGALNEMLNSLQRARNLAVQASNGVYTNSERSMLQKEMSQLTDDVQKAYKSANFSEQNVFNATASTMNSVNQLSEEQAITAGYDDAHIIHNAQEFVDKITGHESESFILTKDINMSSLGVLNKSVIAGVFSGAFDGNGHTIGNLNIDTKGAAIDEIGLFAFAAGATIKNLGVENANINASDSQYVGPLIGYSNSGNTINNCYSSGTVFGKQIVGGLVGSNESSSSISNSYSSADVTASIAFAGGIAGANCNGDAVIENSYSSGSITGGVYVGGITGTNRDNGATVKNCYSTSSLSGTGAVGGIVGRNNGSATAAVINSYSSGGSITSTGSKGGVIGSNNLGYSSGCFYNNDCTTDASGATNGINTTGWDSNIWDLSGGMPSLKVSVPATKNTNTNIQVGSDADINSQISLNLGFDLGTLQFNISEQTSAQKNIEKIDSLISFLSVIRSNVGSNTNKLSSVIDIQGSRLNNYASTNSTLQDTNMAQESANLLASQIRQNSTVLICQQAGKNSKNLILDFYNSMGA